MADQTDEKELDELLDSLLAAYSDAQPRLGFRTRLLANLQAGTRFEVKVGGGKRKWLCIGAAAATLAAILAIYFNRPPDLPGPPRVEVPSMPTLRPHQVVVPFAKRLPTRIAPRETSVLAVTEIRQPVFPTPMPLSGQERLLLRYLAGTPREEVLIQSRSDEPPEGPQPLGPQVQQFSGTEILNTR
jgi:hypothetical protein